METLHIAEAARNSGGIVIGQVKEVAKEGTLDQERYMSRESWLIHWSKLNQKITV